MTLHTTSLHRQAKDLLVHTEYDPKKLVLLHTAVALGVTLLMTAVNFLFSLQIADTGGLGGLGLRTMLSTAQSVLELVVVLVLPFWEIGLIYAALRWAKGEGARPTDLLQGFRRLGTVLAFRLLYGGLFVALAIALFYFSTTVFMMTPWATPLMELFTPIMDTATTPEQLQQMLTPELMSQASGAMTPLFIIFGVILLAVCIPLFYRLRFADFAVMEGMGATKALVHSLRLTQKSSLQVFKLDLHFWWFYLLQLLSLAVCYGDALLAMAGITLPISENAGFFLFYVLGILLQGVLLWQCQGQKLTTYALAYDALRDPAPAPEPESTPQDV